MGGTGSGRPKGGKGSKSPIDKIQASYYLKPESLEKVRVGAMAAGGLKFSQYIERLIQSDEKLTLQILSNEILSNKEKLEKSTLIIETQLNEQKAVIDELSKLLKRLGR